MNENDNYKSVTEYLMESESPQPLNEEQSYALLVEHFGEELVESMTDEERQDFATIVEGIVEGIKLRAVGRLAGGLAKRGAMGLAKGAARVVGTAGHMATLGAGRKIAKGIGKAAGRVKAAVGAEIDKERQSSKNDAAKGNARGGSVESRKKGAEISKQHQARDAAKAAKVKKKPGILSRVASAGGRAFMGTPEPQTASTVYDRIGNLLGEAELTQDQKKARVKYERGEYPVKTVPKKSLGKVQKE